ncbi:uncharacterized protein LOC116252687 [Nymphaea colorata]|nr:uncharacterized protein LOC116252687 [Nymphaea colorata]
MTAWLFLLVLLASTASSLPLTRNSTLRVFPLHTAEVEPSPAAPFLKEILRAISIEEKWEFENTSFSSIKISSAKGGVSHRYEFYLRVGKIMWAAKFTDEVASWKRLRREEKVSNAGIGFLGLASVKPGLKSLKFKGPLELAITGEDAVLLKLPMNTTLTGFKRVLVGEGITLSVKNAQQVSIVDPFNFGMPFNRSSFSSNDKSSWLRYFGHYTSCTPLLHIQIEGPSSVFAYRNSNSKGYIQTEVLSQDMVRLDSEKCYTGQRSGGLGHSTRILDSRLVLLDKLLRSFLGVRLHHEGGFRVLKAKIAASTLVKFQLELEKEVDSGDKILESMPTWITRPTRRRFWFDVLARVEGGELRPVIIKKVRPFIVVESVAWSSLLSNASFGRFSPAKVSPEPFTLNLKW